MNKKINELIQKVQKTANGFKSIQEEAEKFAKCHSVQECLNTSKILLSSDIYQARILATFVLGIVAAKLEEALRYLKQQVSKDGNWRVQEILAKSFDQYCSEVGYQNAMSVIKEWLKDKNPNVRRAVTEGLRIWTSREYFKDNPAVAIKLLSQLKEDESEYVRKSVGNAIRDISKKHKNLVTDELNKWNLENARVKYTYHLASKFL